MYNKICVNGNNLLSKMVHFLEQKGANTHDCITAPPKQTHSPSLKLKGAGSNKESSYSQHLSHFPALSHIVPVLQKDVSSHSFCTGGSTPCLSPTS